MKEHASQLPVYRRIEEDLKSYILERHLVRHSLLPSESVLASQYGVCVSTVRKALNNLVSEKVIYRRHGQGTFVSPRVRKKKVLLVTSLPGAHDNTDNDYFRFFAGALKEANAKDLPYEPLMVQLEDYLANLSDVSMVYPEVGGVMFFRGVANLYRSRAALERQRLPMLFFGPDLPAERDVNCCRIFYREEQIARMGMDYLVSKGYRRIGFCGDNNHTISDHRRHWFRQVLPPGVELVDYDVSVCQDVAALRAMARDVQAVFCSLDMTAIGLIQALELDAGVRVPEELAVMGVDNISAGALIRPRLTTISLCNSANGGKAMRLFSDYLIHGEGEPFEEDGDLNLVVRESC